MNEVMLLLASLSPESQTPRFIFNEKWAECDVTTDNIISEYSWWLEFTLQGNI